MRILVYHHFRDDAIPPAIGAKLIAGVTRLKREAGMLFSKRKYEHGCFSGSWISGAITE